MMIWRKKKPASPSPEKEKETSPFAAGDEPIGSERDDLIGRGRLVEMISRRIFNDPTREPLVIAIHAPWGTGKTSFLNLLEECLTKQPLKEGEKRPMVVRFDPWNYHDVDQLLQMFFLELARGIHDSKWDSNKKKGLIEAVKKTVKKKGLIKAVLKYGGAATSAVPVVGKALKNLANVTVADLSKEKGLRGQKKKLNKQLTGLGRRVVVMVDDIDRLEPDLLQTLFRVLRLNADFKNATYVLAFDPDVVEKNLKKKGITASRDYLEKIVQVSFHLPPPTEDEMFHLFAKEIGKIINSSRFYSRDFCLAPTYYFGSSIRAIIYSFRNLRDLQRYLYGLRFTFPLIVHDLNIEDFLTIEFFRIFHPDLYEKIRFCAPSPPWRAGNKSLAGKEKREKLDQFVVKVLPDISKYRKFLFRKFLVNLYKPVLDDPSGEKMPKENRFCAGKYTAYFFVLDLPSYMFSSIKRKRFIYLLEKDFYSAKREFNKMFLNLMTPNEGEDFLKFLEQVVEDLSMKAAKRFLNLLYTVRDEIPASANLEAKLLAHVIFKTVLRSFLPEEEEERYQQLKLGVHQVYLPAACVIARCLEPNPAWRKNIFSAYPTLGGKVEAILPDRDHWESLRGTFLARVRAAAKTGALWKAPRLLWIMVAWCDWASKAEVQKAFGEHMEDDARFLNMLKHIRREVREQIWYLNCFVPKGYREKYGSFPLLGFEVTWEDFLDIKRARSRLQQLSQAGGEQELLARALLWYLQHHWE